MPGQLNDIAASATTGTLPLSAIAPDASSAPTGRASLSDIAAPVNASGTASLSDIAPTSAPSLIPRGATIQAAPPLSVWQRIAHVFTEGIPQFSSRTVYNPKYGQMQILSPESAMTPVEQARHPILTGAGEFTGGLTGPQNVAILAGTGGLGELPGMSTVAARLLSAGFSAQAITSALRTSSAARDAFERGDSAEGERLLTRALLTGGLGAIGAAHATTGQPLIGNSAEEPATPKSVIEGQGYAYKGEVTPGSGVHQFEDPNNPGKTAALRERDITPENVRAKMAAKLAEFQTRPIPADSPIAQLIGNKPAPAVRIADSDAAKQTLENQQTVLPPRVPLKVFHGTSANVTDIQQLDAAFSRKTGAAGPGLYVTENAEQAGQYAGPQNIATGGRVLGGLLKPDVRLLDGNAELPAPMLQRLREQFRDDVPSTNPPRSYLGFVNALQEGVGNVNDLQREIANAGYDGVRYTADYPSGPRSAIMLFGKDISGKSAADMLEPTVPTARVVSPEYVPTVSQDQVLAAKIQNLIANSGEMQRLGIDPAQIKTPADVSDMLARLAQHIQFNADPRLSTITFAAQRQLASDLGMSVEELLARKSGTAFNAEHAIASRALLDASSNRVVALAAQAASDPARLSEFTDALSQHQGILDSVKGVAAESGRALGSFRVKELPQVKLTNALAGLPEGAQAEAAKLLSKLDVNDARAVNNFVEQIKPSTTADKVFEYYRNALLSSPHVVIVKAASEAAMMALEATKKVVAAGLTAIKGGEDQRYASEAYWYARGAMQALAHAKEVLAGTFNLEDAPGFEPTGQQAIKGTFGKIVRLPQTILSKQSNLMYMLNYFGELNAQAARIAIREGLDGEALHARQAYLAENPTRPMTEAANKLALENTFQSKLAKFGGTVQHGISVEPTGIARFLFPFYKTPINLIKESFGYSPYGLLKGLVKGDVDTTAKGLIGSSIAAGIAKLTLDGYVTGGGPIDFKKRQTLEATGWQPYSIKIGGRYYSYHRLEPLGLALSLVADTVHGAFTQDDPEVTQSKADNAVAHIARNLDDLPFLMTFANLSELTQGDPTTMAERFIGHLASGFVPSAVANVAQTADPTIRRPTSPAEFIESRIPGMTGNVPPYIDANSQAAQRPASALGGANPFPVSTATNDPVVAELARLGVPTTEAPRSIKIRGKASPLTVDEQQAIARDDNQRLYREVKAAMRSPLWVRTPDAAKQRVIEEMRSDIASSRQARVLALRRGQVPAQSTGTARFTLNSNSQKIKPPVNAAPITEP